MEFELVMFNMSSYVEWEKQGIVNRNYHIFNNLLKNKQVKRIIAVDFLPFTFKRALRNYWENIIKKSKVKSQKSKVIYRDLTTKCLKIDGYPAELYIFSSIDSIFSHKLVIKKLNKVLKKITQTSKHPSAQLPRIIYSCFPVFTEYFSGIKSDLTIFDAVDNWIEHPSFSKFKQLLKNNYQIISKRSDLIFTVAEPLLDFFKKLGRKKDVYWIPNGVDINHFFKTQPSNISDPLVGVPRPVIGYVGTIQHRLDLDLLEYLAKKNKDKSFVLIGPLWPVYLRKLRLPAIEIKRLKKYKNIYLLGRKPYQITPDYIKNFDVAIAPHRLDEFIKYTYSLKVLDYLACGRPVVSTPASGVERFSHLVYIAEDYADFNKKIDLALKSDTIELQQKRIERAKQEDWSFKVEKMIRIIKNNL